MATRALIPVEEYLRTSYEGLDREYVDGEVIERAVPPFEHGLLQLIIGGFFRRHRKVHGFWVVSAVRQRTAPGR